MTGRHYGTRTEPVMDTAGTPAGAPIGGLGKLKPGVYADALVLSVTRRAGHMDVIVTLPEGESHVESVEWVPDWVQPGTPAEARVGFLGLDDEFVAVREPDGTVTARRSTPEGQVMFAGDSVGRVAELAIGAGYQPAVPALTELVHVKSGERVNLIPTRRARAAGGSSGPTPALDADSAPASGDPPSGGDGAAAPGPGDDGA